jgi:hypothetical protein
MPKSRLTGSLGGASIDRMVMIPGVGYAFAIRLERNSGSSS